MKTNAPLVSKPYKLAWNVQQMDAHLCNLSKDGLHLVKMGWFRKQFKKSGDERYEYRHDYQSVMAARKGFDEYRASLEAEGWEYVASRVCWHVFRRPYAAGEHPELYADPASRSRYSTRLNQAFLFLGTANLVGFSVNLHHFLQSDASLVRSLITGVAVGLNLTAGLALLYASKKAKLQGGGA
ncbi:DUF2812 domain-containing protein [Gorillibacterium sp. CAU 1737]|uniref:DUF2812 domain-containing protein n=1 Tax=Gorillibacterium sp. CAU 1737 TaxID=3140362 RepID=UPI0032615571